MSKIFISFFLFFSLISCVEPQKSVSYNTLLKEYKGWWIYGEGLHLFKDEKSLNEYIVKFPHEHPAEIIDLYLSVSEMEFYPLEIQIKGVVDNDTLVVDDFEILYIQGCDEQ